MDILGQRQNCNADKLQFLLTKKAFQLILNDFKFSSDWLTDFLFPVIAEEEIEAVEEGVFDVHL